MVRNRKSIVRPRLDVLESRWCPACDIQIAGSAMFITGDAAANEINVFDDGTGVLIVECDGKSSEFTQPIQHVVIRSGHGDDFVGISNIAEIEATERNWAIDLGNGDDIAVVLMEGEFASPNFVTVLGGAGDDQISVQTAARINSLYAVTVIGGNDDDSIFNFTSGPMNGTMGVTLLGGNGNDSIGDFYSFFRVQGTFIGVSDGGNGSDFVGAGLGDIAEFDPNLPPLVLGFDVAAGGHANYAMLGGNDHDALFGSYFGRTDGQFGLVVDAGNGDDEIFAGLNIHVESTGQFTALLRGGNDNDLIGVNVTFFETELVEIEPGFFLEGLAGLSKTPAPLSTRLIVANGGSGFDSCLPSDWVTLLGIEDTQP